MDWYPKSPTDYRNDTWRLSLAAHGAYNLLIDHYYLYEAPLPNDDQALAGIVGCGLEEWLSVRDEVVPLFVKRNALLTHKRCEAELEAAYRIRKDGAKRQKRHRKSLKYNDDVTRLSRVSNGPTLPYRTGQDSRASLDNARAVVTRDIVEANGAIYEHGFQLLVTDWRPVEQGKGSLSEARAEWAVHVETQQLDLRKVLAAASAYCLQQAMAQAKTRHLSTWIGAHGWEDDYDSAILRKEDAIVARHRHEMDLAWTKLEEHLALAPPGDAELIEIDP